MPSNPYPRWAPRLDRILPSEFHRKYEYLEKGQTAEDDSVFLSGMTRTGLRTVYALFLSAYAKMSRPATISTDSRKQTVLFGRDAFERQGADRGQFSDYWANGRDSTAV